MMIVTDIPYLCKLLINSLFMAKKKTKKQPQVYLSPENYIRQKARSLKIKVCYITNGFETAGLGHIIVVREHVGGKVTLGMYLVDKYCLGVKDTFYHFRMEEYDYRDFLYTLDEIGIKEISYEEAHNRIFGAVEFAEEAGIKPHKNFALTQYILEEDDENVPLIEYEYGKDGRHFLVAKSNLEASKYLPLLRKNLGDNFDWVIREPEGDGFDNDDLDDFDDDDYSFLNDGSESPLFKTYGPITKYTYKHPEYPKSVTLENPVVEEILCDPKNASYLTHKQIDMLLALPHDSLRRDLENLILYYIGIGCDGIPGEVLDADFIGVICNAVILLAEVGNEDSSLDVVLELLRQSEDFYEYHICDSGVETFVPTLYKLGQNRLDRLMAFMKEEGLYDFAKANVPEAVAMIVRYTPERREEIVGWFRELVLFATEKLPETQSIDSTVAGLMTNCIMDVKAKELLPEIRSMFDTGLVDEGCCGHYNDVSKEINDDTLHFVEEHLTDVYERFDDMKERFG